MFGEFERSGLDGGRLGELLEGGCGGGQADRVAGEGREFGEQALVAVYLLGVPPLRWTPTD